MTTLSKCLAALVVVLLAAVATLVVVGQGQAQDHADQVDALNAQRIVALADAQAVAEAEAEAQAEKVAEAYEAFEDELREQATIRDDDIQELQMELSFMQHQAAELQRVIQEANEAVTIRAEEIAHLREANEELAIAYRDSLERIEAQGQAIESLSENLAGARGEKEELAAMLEATLADAQRHNAAYHDLLARYKVLENQVEPGDLLPNDLPGDRSDPLIQADIPELTGTVVSIDNIGGGITLVEINLGGEDQVAEEMLFTVYRGDDYVGIIKIAAVDENNAVGQVIRNSDEIAAGDVVRSGE